MLRAPSLLGPYPFPVARDTVTQNADLTSQVGVNADMLGVLVPSGTASVTIAEADTEVGTLVPSIGAVVAIAIAVDELSTLIPNISASDAVSVAESEPAFGSAAPSIGTLTPVVAAMDAVAVGQDAFGALSPQAIANTGDLVTVLAAGALVPQASAAAARPIAADSTGVLAPSVSASELTLGVINADMLGVLAPSVSANEQVTDPVPILAQLSYGADGVFELRGKRQKLAPAPPAPAERFAVVAGRLELVAGGAATGPARASAFGCIQIIGCGYATTELSETEIIHIELAAA